ncbi:hypothetical protein, partial [Burkholderia glumae]|uniref:hypothetical protein n=1 Tax=Burkholderia glumae TaxID=337 RepID=UPI001E6138BB
MGKTCQAGFSKSLRPGVSPGRAGRIRRRGWCGEARLARRTDGIVGAIESMFRAMRVVPAARTARAPAAGLARASMRRAWPAGSFFFVVFSDRARRACKTGWLAGWLAWRGGAAVVRRA